MRFVLILAPLYSVPPAGGKKIKLTGYRQLDYANATYYTFSEMVLI
jgi:hypothetical protein